MFKEVVWAFLFGLSSSRQFVLITKVKTVPFLSLSDFLIIWGTLQQSTDKQKCNFLYWEENVFANQTRPNSCCAKYKVQKYKNTKYKIQNTETYCLPGERSNIRLCPSLKSKHPSPSLNVRHRWDLENPRQGSQRT